MLFIVCCYLKKTTTTVWRKHLACDLERCSVNNKPLTTNN